MDDRYRPIDLARRAGIGSSSVRSYERLGFLPPAERSPAGHRIYRLRHALAMDASRALIQGYGWETARHIMQAVHQSEIVVALRIIDVHHAEIERARKDASTLASGLRDLIQYEEKSSSAEVRRFPIRIGELAAMIGVRESAIRFWEAEGLLQPRRDAMNHYRLFNEVDVRTVRVVSLLRAAGYGFTDIRIMLQELQQATPDAALDAISRRERSLDETSWNCLKGSALLWTYLEDAGHDFTRK
ncbi:MAG: MerR family transcriptional regulator [Thermomicrobiales bacterium]